VRVEKTDDITWVARNNLCYGCGLCDIICPREAISFHITNMGRLKPAIDYTKCNGCSLCLKVCPGMDDGNLILDALAGIEDPFTGSTLSCHVGMASSEEVYINAQSGGLVTQTLRYLFDTEQITHAVLVYMQYGKPPRPIASVVTSPEQLFDTQKSTYVPVNLLSALKTIPATNSSIAVVGLPCHMEGILSLDNLGKAAHRVNYKLGLMCDGILTYIALNYFEKRANVPSHIPYRIVFKDKARFNYLDANITIQQSDGRQRHINKEERFILKKYLTPPRCLICFNKMNLFADLSYGDPWHLGTSIPSHGLGVVISRTSRGYQLVVDLERKRYAHLNSISYTDFLTGQEIEKRKRRVAKGIRDYEDLDLHLPTYYATLLRDHLNNYRPSRHHSNYVAKFLQTEEARVDRIVDHIFSKVKRTLFLGAMKGKVKSSLRSIASLPP